MIYDWQWHHDANELCDNGDWDEAEEIYVSVGEQTNRKNTACSAINSLVFAILIPQKRFVEARIWLQDALNLEVVYEVWNSLENLGVCEYYNGNNELAERYLQYVVDAGQGPVDDAQKFLDKIRAGKFAKPVPQFDLEYRDDWRDVDVSGPIDPKASQREFYLRLIKYMYDTKQELGVDSFEQSAGGSVTGFANGIMSKDLIDMGFSRDAAAKACYDYMMYVQLGRDPQEDFFATGLALWEQGKRKEALKKLRVSAREGNSDAMWLVAQAVDEMYDEDLALPWYKLAAANGSSEAKNHVVRLESSDWEDDDSESESEKSSESEARFCTDCGSPREVQAKFCTNCGTAF